MPTFSFAAKIRQCLSDGVYGLFRAILILAFRVFFRVKVKGLEHCPKNGGPLLIASNHISEWDPPFLGSFLPWQVHWVAKIELFELLGGYMNAFFRMLHCVPVDREKADLSAVKEVMRLLRERRPVVVFSEGGVRTDSRSILGTSPQLKEGAASMAIMAGCPIMPVLLNGTIAAYRWQNWFFRKHHLEIIIGPVFQLEGRDREEASQQILTHMLALKPQLEQQHPC